MQVSRRKLKDISELCSSNKLLEGILQKKDRKGSIANANYLGVDKSIDYLLALILIKDFIFN